MRLTCVAPQSRVSLNVTLNAVAHAFCNIAHRHRPQYHSHDAAPQATVDLKLPYLRPWLRLALVNRQIRFATRDAATRPVAQGLRQPAVARDVPVSGKHSVTGGSAYEAVAWRAVQRAAWAAVRPYGKALVARKGRDESPSRKTGETLMPAYFIAELDIHDRAGFGAYVAAVGPVLEQFSAKYLVAGPKGGVVEVLEGRWNPKKITLIEFPSKDRALEFFRSSEFRRVVGLRHNSAETNLVLVEGVEADMQRPTAWASPSP